MDRRVSSRRAIVIIEEPAQPLATANPIDTIDRRCAVDELIAEALVVQTPFQALRTLDQAGVPEPSDPVRRPSSTPDDRGVRRALPRRLRHTVGRGFHAVFAEDVGDRASGDPMIQIGQGALDPRVAPGAVFCSHAHDQRADLHHDTPASRAATSASVVLLGDQCPMPGQQRVRRHDCRDVPQHAPAEYLSFRRQPTALIVREP